MAEKVTRRSVALNLEVEKGSTFRLTLVWTYQDEHSTPIDLTDCTAMMQIRPEIDSEELYYSMDTNTEYVDPRIEPPIVEPIVPGIVLGGSAGTVDLYIPADDSTLWDWDEAVYGLEITFPDTDVRRLCRGSVVAYDETVRVSSPETV